MRQRLPRTMRVIGTVLEPGLSVGACHVTVPSLRRAAHKHSK